MTLTGSQPVVSVTARAMLAGHGSTGRRRPANVGLVAVAAVSPQLGVEAADT
jgi:hypothetical protein